MKRVLPIVTFVIFAYFCSEAQNVYSNDFGSTTISGCGAVPNAGTLDANLSGESWSSTAAGGCTSFSGASGQALSTSGGNTSFTLSLTIANGYKMDLTAFSFWTRRSNTGPQNWELSIDDNGTVSSLATGDSVNSSSASTGAENGTLALMDLTGTISFTITATGASGTGTFRLDDFTLTGSTILPVELASFNTTKSKEAVELNWTTASEINNDHFVVEYSKDGVNFTELDRVEGNGTTNREMNYSYMHESPASAMNYYRLKQVDYDGAFEYSDVRSVNFKSETGRAFSLYPTITDTKVTVQYKQDIENVKLAIYNMQGQLVYNNTVVNGESVDVSALKVGTYIAQLVSSNELQTLRFIKQ